MPDDSQDVLQGDFTKAPIDYPLIPHEGVLDKADPIALDIDDEDLARISQKRIDDDLKWYKEKLHLYDRRKKNEVYYFGRQVFERERKGEMKDYESRNQDNVLYEIEGSIKPLAMSHMPDIIVTPGKEGDKESIDSAKQITKCTDTEIKSKNNRKVVGLAFKHLPVYFVGAVKGRWNPELGKYGDYVFDTIHPDYIVFDHNCPTNNADDMAYVAQILPITVQELIMRFPKKKTEIFAVLKKKGLMVDDQEEPTWEQMASTVKIWEIWADWYKRSDTGEVDTQPPLPDDQNKWEKISGVIWKFDDLILKKMKNPNYDHVGEEKIFTYDTAGDESTKREVTDEEVVQAVVTGMMPPNATKEQVYHNYFDMPRKPFFFMGYDQWGKQPLDETSRIEQNLHNQEILDRRGKQIDETLNNRGKHVFSKDGGLKPDDIEKMDMNDPRQDIIIEGDVNKTHQFIPPDRPTSQEFQDLDMTRNRMYGLAGANAIRGQIQSQVATTNQIAREADYTRADDLVEDTINAAVQWMAQYALQFIKLRYTQNHFRRILGDKGEVVFIKLHRDLIEDGMEVMIKASGTDKLKAQNNAMEMAKLKLIDPLTFFEDMGLSDPKGRADKLMTFSIDPASYMVKFVMEQETTEQMVDGLLGPGSAQALGGGAPAPAGAPVAPASPVTQPSVNPTPTNTAQAPVQPSVGSPQGSPRLL